MPLAGIVLLDLRLQASYFPKTTIEVRSGNNVDDGWNGDGFRAGIGFLVGFWLLNLEYRKLTYNEKSDASNNGEIIRMPGKR